MFDIGICKCYNLAMSPDYNPDVLKAARERLGLSKSEAARRLDKDRMTIVRSEEGRNTSLRVLRSICALYQIPLSEVLRLDDEVPAGRVS
jgi:DNA-binding XRE family transcriptional regulator